MVKTPITGLIKKRTRWILCSILQGPGQHWRERTPGVFWYRGIDAREDMEIFPFGENLLTTLAATWIVMPSLKCITCNLRAWIPISSYPCKCRVWPPSLMLFHIYTSKHPCTCGIGLLWYWRQGQNGCSTHIFLLIHTAICLAALL